MVRALSSETLHATTVAIEGRSVLLYGASGMGMAGAVARFGGLFAPAIIAPIMASHFTLSLAVLSSMRRARSRRGVSPSQKAWRKSST